MNEFEGPGTFWIVFTVVGGFITGLGLIMSLELIRDRLPNHFESRVEAGLIVPLQDLSP